ncbi:RtcB family protein [Salidesulfovibrio onnuriiensis]|uniref:RtcB family protein n=1 Tax=Salidesulfovibrio onnuriiensis TaxID=2583823 RepID=UPI0011C8569E|nr:RtcB family protein [Salidesulfovibrio onnuriiensis]
MKAVGILQRHGEYEWHLPKTGDMLVPGIIYGSHAIIRDMDPAAIQQVRDVACLPGIVRAAMAMPDAHKGYGFPIGGVAAFDPKNGGVVSAGGVGFDIACGVRTLLTGLTRDDILSRQEELAEALFRAVPSGVGKGGSILLDGDEMDAMLSKGAAWAVSRGFGVGRDLERCEEKGTMAGADPREVSRQAKARMHDQMGSLGSGNHYLEVQWVERILDAEKAGGYGLREGDAVVSIHCGSRGLGHQRGTNFLEEMAPRRKGRRKIMGVVIPNRELACAPIESELGQRYLGAMRAGINCALANRQVISHLTRQAFAEAFPNARLDLLYDVSHNTCKAEKHDTGGGAMKTVYVHRKGATRSFPPGHPSLPADIRAAGQPVLVGGSMGTPSFILAGTECSMQASFGSACHGAGRALSRTAAKKRFIGRDIAESLRHQGIFVRSFSFKGIAEEAPGAYKDIIEVITSARYAGLAAPVARLRPLVCVKG